MFSHHKPLRAPLRRKAGKSLSIMSLQIYSQIHYVYKMSINDADKTTTNDVDKTAINYDYENPIKLV